MADKQSAHTSSPEYDVLAALDLDHQQFADRGESSLFGDAAAEIRDLRSRLACVVEASYWDRPYDTRLDAIRGMCDLATDGMSPAEVDEHKRTGWQLYNELVDRWNVERLHLQSVIDQLKSLLTRACEADAAEDCRFDHHGDCQAHGPWGDGEPCPYPFIRQYIAPSESHTPPGAELDSGDRS